MEFFYIIGDAILLEEWSLTFSAHVDLERGTGIYVHVPAQVVANLDWPSDRFYRIRAMKEYGPGPCSWEGTEVSGLPEGCARIEIGAVTA